MSKNKKREDIRNAEKVDEAGCANNKNLHSYTLSTGSCFEAFRRIECFYSRECISTLHIALEQW